MKLPAYTRTKPSGVEWLGDVPEHWDVRRLKMAVQLTDRKVEAEAENPRPYVGMENIESWTGRLLPLNPDTVPTGTANAFTAGSTLFGKLRPYLAKACNPDFDGLCSTELLVLRSSKMNESILLYFLLSDAFIKLIDSSTFGSKMPRADWDFIGNCLLPLPPAGEQTRIVKYLDRETGQIDRLIGKKRELIERLKEKRTALISRTVTRGLPAEAAAEAGIPAPSTFNPSGLDWVGNFPEHWRLLRLRNLSGRISGRLVYQPAQYFELEGVPFLMGNNVTENGIVWQDVKLIPEDINAKFARHALREGDVVTVRVGDPGVTCVVPKSADGLNCGSLMIIRRAPHFDSQWLSHVMNSLVVRSQIALVQYGAAQEQINITDAVNFLIPTPPLYEQIAIAAYLQSETATIDGLVAKVEEAIERLQEYRTALITAAVTGKIDVRRAIA